MSDFIVSHNSSIPVVSLPVQSVIRPAQNHSQGIHTYYVPSNSKPGVEYAVQQIRKPGMNRWQCSCPQFFFRCAAKRRHCKHVRIVRRELAALVAQAA